MTKTYAARQLLALGPLSFAEFVEITGWSRAVCRWVLTYLVDALGQVRRADGLYWIANANQLPTCENWKPKQNPAMAKLRFARCALGPPWAFLPPLQTCDRHKPVAADVAEARRKWKAKG